MSEQQEQSQSQQQSQQEQEQEKSQQQSQQEQEQEQSQQQSQQEQEQSQQQSQEEQEQSQQQQQQDPNLPEFLFPFTFVIRQQPSSQNTTQNTNDQPTTPPMTAHFFFYPISGTGADSGDQTQPSFVFFTPFFFPQENRRSVSESTMKELPIIEVTQELIDAQASCPICLEPFSLPSNNNDDQKSDKDSTDKETSSSSPESIRQMPCKHTFCESCLFRWLKQNNTCPLCRKEIESENTSQQSEQTTESTTAVPSQEDVTMDDASLSTSTESNSTFAQSSHTHSSHYSNNNNDPHEVFTSCALGGDVGCCELQNNEELHTTSPIITLPQCHHRFHASCLRTSLIVEGYSFESPTSQPLHFHCPTCRSQAIIQSDMLKTPSANLSNNSLLPQEQQQPSSPHVPVVIPHLPPNPDEMDLD